MGSTIIWLACFAGCRGLCFWGIARSQKRPWWKTPPYFSSGKVRKWPLLQLINFKEWNMLHKVSKLNSQPNIKYSSPWALKPNLLQWGVLGQKLMLNLCRWPRLWLKLLLLTFWKFGLWPCDLLAFGLCDLAEILPLEMGVHKKAAYQISSKSVQKWLSYCSIQVLALAFY